MGQEPPYFVTYSHVLEEPGNLEVATQNIGASPKNANAFYGQTIELEYGVTAWYTAEVYFQGHTTLNDSTVFDDVVNHSIRVSAPAKAGGLRNAPAQFANMSLSADDLQALVAFLTSITEDYDDA